MSAEPTELTLDMDDFPAVLARAVQLHGLGRVRGLFTPAPTCGRALAVARLQVRRHACGPPPPEGWSYTYVLHLADEELGRMAAEPDIPAAALEGCGCDSCVYCHPARCGVCGGIVPWACSP